MFRIRILYENESTVLLRVEGSITARVSKEWREAISQLVEKQSKSILMDLSEVTFVSRDTILAFMEKISDNLFLFNCPMMMKNLLHNSVSSRNLLDANE